MSPPAGSPDDALLTQCTASARVTAERYRGDCWVDGVFVPDDEVKTGATALAGRLYRRRNTPSGVETFADSTLYVARFDPEIERALWMSGYLAPNLTFGA